MQLEQIQIEREEAGIVAASSAQAIALSSSPYNSGGSGKTNKFKMSEGAIGGLVVDTKSTTLLRVILSPNPSNYLPKRLKPPENGKVADPGPRFLSR